ncbi:MAG: hypothetical protein K2X86_01885 [Cytophagaceae bacterium]|nr:hypothetical protein [Cytophagaceae bacterium]
MYNSIRFATLHLHAAHEADSRTIFKTKAIYENDYFIFHQQELIKPNHSSHQVKKTIYQKASNAEGNYQEILEKFVWHLN